MTLLVCLVYGWLSFAVSFVVVSLFVSVCVSVSVVVSGLSSSCFVLFRYFLLCRLVVVSCRNTPLTSLL